MDGYCDICGTELSNRSHAERVRLSAYDAPIVVCPECALAAEDMYGDEVEYLEWEDA